jgi:hypothetical protein
MTKYAFGLCLCGSLLFISGCGGGSGARQSGQIHPLVITSAVLPQAVLRESYCGSSGFSVTAAGGVAPYIWSWKAADGSTLPPGLKLSSNADGTGTISGTPTTTGPYGVIVTVTDSGPPAGQTSETYIITVAATRPTRSSRNRTPEIPELGASHLPFAWRSVECSGPLTIAD